jgi:hypothetical protein
MKYYLNGEIEGKKRLNILCLRVSDYNTKGMTFDPSNRKSPLYAFLRSGGVSAKSQGSGGSFGFGKGAYYTLSPIKTIVVSTRDEYDNVFFEGSTILTTHFDENGIKHTAYGYYDNNDGEPTYLDEKIPEIFKRKEIGTDVNIIGLWDEKYRKKLMVKSVLKNFWLAIQDEKLIVEIDDIVIDKANLEHIIDDYFENDFEGGAASNIEDWNPKPYYKAVKNAYRSEQFQVFEDHLEILGNVKLYVYLKKGLPNRTSFMRSPKMVVYKRTNRKVNGYSAVFVCDNEKGNELLRLMENPAHNEWKKENYPRKDGKIDKTARKAENELGDFINDILDTLSKVNFSKQTSVLGLEEYLFSTEELLENFEETDSHGNSLNNIGGELTDEITDEETGLQTTAKDSPIKIKPTLKPNNEIKDSENVEVDETGELKISSGGDNDSDGGDQVGQGDSSISTGSNTDEETENKNYVAVSLKVVAYSESGRIIHDLIINAPVNIDNAEIELLVGSDNERDDGIALVYSNNGNISGNVISNVHLNSGKNNIKVQFADNVKHAIKVKTYEI